MIRKFYALVKKDFLVESSYKFSFVLNIFSVGISLLAYFFIDKLFAFKITEHLKEFGVSYFSYVLLSMAFFSYIGAGIGSFSSRLRSEQLQGTLESLLTTPTKPWIILGGMALWNLIFATLDTGIYIGLGIFLFKINFSNINIISTAAIFILSVISFSSLGIISASFTLVFKKGNPVGWVINNLEGLLGGVYFPITIMPPFLQAMAHFFPITYAIRAIELSVYKGYTLGQLKTELLFLLLFCLILAPLSLYIFSAALKKSRKQGSLSSY